jgi:hypothetical protein
MRPCPGQQGKAQYACIANERQCYEYRGTWGYVGTGYNPADPLAGNPNRASQGDRDTSAQPNNAITLPTVTIGNEPPDSGVDTLAFTGSITPAHERAMRSQDWTRSGLDRDGNSGTNIWLVGTGENQRLVGGIGCSRNNTRACGAGVVETQGGTLTDNQSVMEAHRSATRGESGIAVAGINEPGAGRRTPASTDRQPGAADRQPGATDRQPGAADRQPGATDRQPGVADRQPGAADDDRTGGAAPQQPLVPDPLSGKGALTYQESRDLRGMQADDVNDGNDCGVSSGISGGEYSCGGTKTMIEAAKVTNAVTQTVGSTAVTVMGQLAQQKASMSNSQAEMMKAGAETQITGGKIQVATGAVNAALGIVQIAQGASHRSNANQISGEANKSFSFDQSGRLQAGSNRIAGNQALRARAEGVTMQAMQRQDQYYANDPARKAEAKRAVAEQAKSDYQVSVRGIAAKAVGEQKGVAKEAFAGGVMSLVTGAGQMVQGGFNIAAGNTLKDAANKLKAAENGAMSFAGGQLPGFGDNMVPEGSAPRSGQSITGSGANPEAAPAVEEDDEKLDTPNLGRGFDPNGPQGGVANGPAAGKFGAGAPGAGPGASSVGGGLGGGSTSPATAGGEDPAAKYADSNRNPNSYDTSGGAMMGGGGGGGGGDKGPDLSGLLAQFLPKKEDEQTGNGIMDFGGRDPASEPQGSLLDRNANIFKRIHEAYQEKHQKGFIGI